MVTTKSAEIRDAESTLTELRRTLQTLEIDLDSMKNQVSVLQSPAAVLLASAPAVSSHLSLLHTPHPTPNQEIP